MQAFLQTDAAVECTILWPYQPVSQLYWNVMEGNVFHITTGNWDTEKVELYIDVTVCSLDSGIPYWILFHARGLDNPFVAFCQSTN